MPFIQVQTYTVVCGRLPGLVRNVLRVAPVPFVGSGNAVEYVELTYNVTATTPPVLGSIAQTTPPRVFAFLPVEDFATHRMLLQTEAPVEIEWQTNPAAPSILSSLEIRTQAETPGEGPADTN